MREFHKFRHAFEFYREQMKGAEQIHTEKWQGMDISAMPAAKMHELLYKSFICPVYNEDLEVLAWDIQPNLPWADEHFTKERVSGLPVNPGETWKDWPWGLAADKHRTEGEKFNHTYAERYWPKVAEISELGGFHRGIRYPYGDLGDVVELLLREPLTRQAILPVYFPEDTGSLHGSRVPCSIAYHFMVRDDKLHVSYWLRSCDLVRHFRDDVYLTVRLQLWVLEQLRRRNSLWLAIRPGNLIMHMDSLHCFVNDLRLLEKKDD